MILTAGSFVTAIVMMSDSGDFASELDFGRSIRSLSGGWNWVVVMKKIRSRNATSTMGVMSMLTPILRFFLSMVSLRFRSRLLLVRGGGREQLQHLVRRLVHHVVEVVHARHEHVVHDDAEDGHEQAAGRVHERLG